MEKSPNYSYCFSKRCKNPIKYIMDKMDLFSIDWFSIPIKYKLSPEFIETFKDKLNWFNISGHQTLSEDMIRKYQDKVDWNQISMNQKMSDQFIAEFRYHLNMSYIKRFQKILRTQDR